MVVDRSEEILTPKKPAPTAKKSTPPTPEQAATEALWKFQAAHAEVKDGEAETSFADPLALAMMPPCRSPSIRYAGWPLRE